jgi:2-polyprenyl-3-methyl-5-hydroxy-6-metoxy-1,4-benzoquinol methylase
MAERRDGVKGYHGFVFDEAERRLVGAFDEMYRAEQSEGFDSWHQEDQRNLTRRVALEVLSQWNFGRVLDIGCGKGVFTHQLRRRNNEVVGVDISEAALAVARARYPDVRFVQADVADAAFDWRSLGERFDLGVSLETLSYIADWRGVLARLAALTRHTLIGLYLPENPIGHVKTFDDLAAAFGQSFEIVEDIRFVTRSQIVLFGASRGGR